MYSFIRDSLREWESLSLEKKIKLCFSVGFFSQIFFFIALPFKELVLYNKDSKNKQMVLFTNTEPKTERTVGVLRDCWRLLSPTSLLKQAHLRQAAQGCFQITFEYIQRWGLHILSLGSLFQCFVTLKVVFPLYNLNFLYFCLWPLHFFPCLAPLRSWPHPLDTLTSDNCIHWWLPLNWLFLRLKRPNPHAFPIS